MKLRKSFMLFFFLSVGYMIILLKRDTFMYVFHITHPNKMNLKIRLNASINNNITNPKRDSVPQQPELKCEFLDSRLPTNMSFFLTDHWRRIFNTSVDEFIYSAYRNEEIVRIIGAKKTTWKYSAAKICKIWYRFPNKTVCVGTVPVHSSVLPEHHNRKFSAAYYNCPLNTQKEVVAVALAKTDGTSPSELDILPVVTPHPNTVGKRTFSICGPILQRNYSKVNQLIEWIELNMVLGAQFITFYNYSMSRVLEPVFLYYSELGRVEVVPWNMPISVETPEIHYVGQMAAINDCLYRNRNKTKYLAFFDLDEFIIPKMKHDFSWTDMFKRLPNASSYGFRNVFFRTNMKLNLTGDTIEERLNLTSLLRLHRDVRITPFRDRSKLIIDPLKVETIGIHFVWKHKEGKTYVVGEKTGLLHHYRFITKKTLKLDQNKSTADQGVLKYRNDLIKRLRTFGIV